MAIIRNGANGGFSGKAGSVIGSSWKDIQYIKGLPKLSGKTPTQNQMEQQARFFLAVKFLKPVKSLLNYTYSKQKTGTATGFNMALRHVLRNAVIGAYPDLTIDYPAVEFSTGSLAVPSGGTLVQQAGELTLNWSTQLNRFNAFMDDEAIVLVYNPSNGIYLDGPDNVLRSTGEMTISLPADYAGQTIHTYMFFTSRDGKEVSGSTYLGSSVVA